MAGTIREALEATFQQLNDEGLAIQVERRMLRAQHDSLVDELIALEGTKAEAMRRGDGPEVRRLRDVAEDRTIELGCIKAQLDALERRHDALLERRSALALDPEKRQAWFAWRDREASRTTTEDTKMRATSAGPDFEAPAPPSPVSAGAPAEDKAGGEPYAS